MKIKLAEVKVRYKTLCSLANKKLPVKVSYAISKNIMKLQEETETLEKERVKLAEQYAVKGEDGEPKVIDNSYVMEENQEAFAKEYQEFLDTETEVMIYTIPEDVMECMDDSRYDVLTPAELIALDFMIEHPEAEPKA